MNTPSRGIPGRPLSPQQIACVSRAAEGMTNRQIAQELGVTENTVKTHLRRANRQTGTWCRTQLVAAALSAELIPRVKAPHPTAVHL